MRYVNYAEDCIEAKKNKLVNKYKQTLGRMITFKEDKSHKIMMNLQKYKEDMIENQPDYN